MRYQDHSALAGFIWTIANKLRGPYRPPQYRKVMLPLIVLRRLDLVLEPTKERVLAEHVRLAEKGFTGAALEKALSRAAVGGERTQPLYNTSPFTFQKLLGDPPNIASNLVAYILGFSPRARDIFEKFEFENEIQKLDENNRLFLVIKEFCSPLVDLSPQRLSNLQMGYLFEELVRKFNEQANEEAGDHFTPREVIRLMVNLLFCEETEVFKPGIYRSVYDPTAGTGGMLSVSEEFIKAQNPDAHLELFGQEYNPESFAICCSDLLIKDEPIDNLVFGDTLGVKDARARSGNFLPYDGHPDKQFHYMLANPPFGVEWRPEQAYVEEEHKKLGFSGRFGPGLPRINDGSLLFLLHMIAKMHSPPEHGGDGSKIAIVFNGSPLFTGDAGSGESNIRRWIVENDWLDAVVALPDQMFYNTGIYTYIWIVSNKKPAHRRGKVQLIDGTRHFQKMKKSLGDKRNELSGAHIAELVRLYGEYGGFREDPSPPGGGVFPEASPSARVCSKILDNHEFGYLKITVERPLRLNFQASAERVARLWGESAFVNLAVSSKRKDKAGQAADIAAGEEQQRAILAVLGTLDPAPVHRARDAFEKVLDVALKAAGLKPSAAVKKAIFAALGERDPAAEICRDGKGEPEADPDLRDSELVPLPQNIALPLPLGYDDKQTGLDQLLPLVKDHIDAYIAREVLPHVPDAWVDYQKTKVGYEIPLTRQFYVYQPSRPLDEIEGDIQRLEAEILQMLGEVL